MSTKAEIEEFLFNKTKFSFKIIFEIIEDNIISPTVIILFLGRINKNQKIKLHKLASEIKYLFIPVFSNLKIAFCEDVSSNWKIVLAKYEQ